MACELALLFSLSIQKYSQASQSSVVWTPNVISSSCMSAEWLGYTPFITLPPHGKKRVLVSWLGCVGWDKKFSFLGRFLSSMVFAISNLVKKIN